MDAISLLNHGLAGRYLVEREIGAGGMATVFLARDLRHDRHVALKVVEPELAAVLGGERFLSEIRVTAKLQHPNLLPLFDSGESGGLLYYVMPYVEGETLRHRLDREKQLPVDEALRLAIAICGALDYAHRHGVIHRDLKPENVLLHDGQPVIADFGIALAISNAGGTRLTQTGLSLGTPQYMSPEQATGDRTIDARADIYSVGAVLYEMLTGEAPHGGPTAQAVIGKLMTEIPAPVSSLRRSVPPHVDGAVNRALEKLPADRFTTAGRFADALSAKSVVLPPQQNTYSRSIKLSAIVAASVAALSLAASAWMLAHRGSAVPPTQRLRFSLVLPDSQALDATTFLRSLDLSPDGSKVVYTGINGLFIRPLDTLALRRLTSEPGSEPKFSPDGAWVAYISNSKLRKVPVAGGTPTTIVDSVARFGWSSKGIIVFTRSGPATADLWRVGENGDSAMRFVHQRRPIDAAYGTPSFLPDGDAFLVPLVVAGGASSELAAYRFSDDSMRYLGPPGDHPIYVDGLLLYVTSTDGGVAAVPFDAQSLRQTGAPTPVLQGVMRRSSSAELAVSSATGTMVYLPGALPRPLVEFDRAGREYPLPHPPGFYSSPRYSPDGRRAALAVFDLSGADVWIYGMSSTSKQRLSESHRAGAPEWTADGKRVGWTEVEFGAGARAAELKSARTFWRPVDQSDTASLLVEGGLGMSFAPVGGYAVMGIAGRGGQPAVYSVDLDSTRRRTEIVRPIGPPAQRVSPDGRFIAYVSQAMGLSEVYVRPLTPNGVPVRISSGGGTEPMWNPRGHELFYRSGSRVLAVTLSANSGAPVTPADALPFRIEGSGPWANYDISPNGQRILTVGAGVGGDQPIVVTRWLDEVREKFKKRE